MFPKISIITPSYNQGKFLEDCIQSVFSQDYPNLEYIIVDGGSQDNSVEIIHRYSKKLTYWSSEPDEGQTDAINKGFHRASGDIVAWLNSDDYYLSGAFNRIAEIYNRYPEASFIFGNGIRVDKNKDFIAKYFPENEVRFNFPALLFGLNYILQPATFINRKMLEKVNYLNPELKFGMDSDLWIRLSLEAEPIPIQSFLAASREYQDTKSKSVFFPRIEELRLISEKYTGVEMTPGVLCYFLDTLSRYIQETPNIFSDKFTKELNDFWSSAANQMKFYGARPDGSPLHNNSVRNRSPIINDSLERLRFNSSQKTNQKPVGIELRQVTLGKSGGIVQHLIHLLVTLFEKNAQRNFVVFCTIFNRHLLPDHPNVTFITLPASTFFSRLDQELRIHDIQVLFRSYPIVDDLAFDLQRQIFFVPDLQHETFPEYFDTETLIARKKSFNIALSSAGAIATNSRFTRQTILDHPKTKCKDIFLVSPSLQPSFLEDQRPLTYEENLIIPQVPFFYFPANLWPHKNHRVLLEAFALFLEKSGLDYELILSGHPDGWEKLRVEFPHLPVEHLGFVSLPVVHKLYKKATALVYLSLYEGFGIPILEAFALGTPVICSNTTSLPEVGGEAVLSCDPKDVATIADAMTAIVNDDSLGEDLILRSKKQLEKYTWEKSAQNLADAINRVEINSTKFKDKDEDTPRIEDINPLVSIITPSYNQGEFIRKTIESVLNQSYPNVEYILVDGGSTDDTIAVLEDYGDRFKWVSETDRGQSHAINKGFAWSNGEIRGYLNSDDVLEKDAIEKVVTFFSDNPNCDMVYGRAYYIDEHDNITGMYKTDDYSFTRLMQDCNICQPAAFWRTSAADIIGEFDENLVMAMDYDYWLKLGKAGLIIHHIPDILASSRLHPNSKTLCSRRKAYEEAFRVCQRNGGYVDINYFYGLWDYLIWQKQSGIPHIFFRWRNSFKLLAKIHHKLYHSFEKSKSILKIRNFRVVTSRTKRMIINKAKRYLGFVRPLARSIRSMRYEVSPDRPVFGFWSDNWLAPVVQFYIGRKALEGFYFLEGIPAADMVVRIKVNRALIDRQELKGGKYTRLEFPVQKDQRLILSFSKPVFDPSNRYVSFLVEGTNLFTEDDPIIE